MAQSISQEAIGATGLPGATAASRYAGATTSGAPTTGTFAVGDYVIDQTGKIYVCTVAGTPGTWVQTGGGAAAPGTTVSSFITTDLNNNTANSFLNITSISLTAGTWLINYQSCVFNEGSGSNSVVVFIGTSSASSTGLIASCGTILGYGSSNYSYSQMINGTYSLVVSGTTTIYLNGIANKAITYYSNFGFSVLSAGVNVTGIVAVRTA